MKEIAILTYSIDAADLYFNILTDVLQNVVKIRKYSVEEDNINNPINADLAILSAFELFDLTKKYISKDVQIMIPNLTIKKASFTQIQKLPQGTQALIVNATFGMAVECVEQIYRFGARHIELVPYSPYLDNVKDIDLAITPGENQYIPKWVDKVIDIGKRVFDISTIVNILIYLNKEELFITEKMKEYCSQIMPQNYMPQTDHRLNPFSMNDFFISNYRFGIIGFSPGGMILNFNNAAEKILGYRKEAVIGENIMTLFSDPQLKETIRDLKPQRKKQINLNGQDLLVDINIGYVSSTKICYMTLERMHQNAVGIPSAKNQIAGKGYTAKYFFSDIVTGNEEMQKLKKIGAQNAASDSSVLLIGESGTGKELFAQAIHNESARRNAPFVAINCAAVAESLLESELFGYDEGAFTGAKRGGKKGLFELAHTGTIFLDEIGEMPAHLQARLLRVLQEKEVTHVGGNQVISIDIRVIAATNCNVLELIKENKFRKDLYYRLNVITLKLPALRARRNDISLLIEEFKKQFKVDFKIDLDAFEKLYNHEWDGNIRELHNYIEYFKNLRKPRITINDIPFLQINNPDSSFSYDENVESIKNAKKTDEKAHTEVLSILEILYKSAEENRTAGRRYIAEMSRKRNEFLSEIRIRSLLEKMQEQGLVKILKGRGGTKLTSQGLEFLKKYTNV